MYLCYGITLKAINGQRSHRTDFKYILVVNVLVEETISTGKCNIFHGHTILTFPAVYILRSTTKDFLQILILYEVLTFKRNFKSNISLLNYRMLL